MRFGITTADITPPFKTTMGGYGGRQDYFDKVNDPLSCTVLILEEKGQKALIAAADLITFHDEQAVSLRQQLAELAGTSPDNVMLNASHTHGGPEPRDKGSYFHALRDTASSVKYREFLREQILKAAAETAGKMEEGSLWFGIGKSSIPMNRRLERNGEIVNAPNPEGPVDERIQVLAIRNKEGILRALGIRLSCHPVATGAQHLLTADFPGAFKKACADALGNGVTPFFLQGAGGDMRPSPVADGDKWRQMDHAELPSIGQTLLHETLEVLNNSNAMEKLDTLELAGHFEYALASCERQYCKKEDFEKLLSSNISIERIYAQNALCRLEKGETIPDTEKIGVHTLWLNKDIAIVGIQGEVLIGLGAHVEKKLAPKHTILLGYCNGCLCYLPDSKELKRGGYEQSSYLYHGWTGPFAPGLEDTLTASVFIPE
ncbi:MAG: hypothetical protein A2017_21545 [Lentisphaerae bacterium GWF2_44_16]|nr:MAG: hypothetical protein A2017_21545 [Lentisphaerae bacterium GWF2_44_16]